MKSSEVLLRDLARVYLMAHRLTDRAMTAQGASFARTRLLLLIQAGNGRARAADIAEVFTMAPRSVTDAVDEGDVRRSWDQTHTVNLGVLWASGPWQATRLFP